MGIVGFGKLGQFLADQIGSPALRETHELAFVWNRKAEVLSGMVPPHLRLGDLEDFRDYSPDLIVEVAHPAITHTYGPQFLEHCDYMAGSPTAFAILDTEAAMRRAAREPNGYGLYIPRGALPGLEDILRMVENNSLETGRISMMKHPSSLKYHGPLNFDLEAIDRKTTVYDGPLRSLCEFAPNNVNTMAVFAMASRLGFDEIQAQLIADPTLEHHITAVALLGPDDGGPRYSLDLVRRSPAGPRAVTSTATLSSFAASMIRSCGGGDGVFYR